MWLNWRTKDKQSRSTDVGVGLGLADWIDGDNFMKICGLRVLKGVVG